MNVEEFRKQHGELRRLYDNTYNDEERKAILRMMDHLGKTFSAHLAQQPITIKVTPEQARAIADSRLTPTQRFDRGNSRRQAIREQRARRE
jgi:hypothetical protein